jgi:hypothetical protein
LSRPQVRSIIACGGKRSNFAWLSADRVVLGDVEVGGRGGSFSATLDRMLLQVRVIKTLLGDATRIFFVRLNLRDLVASSGAVASSEASGASEAADTLLNLAYSQCIARFIDVDVSKFEAGVPCVKFFNFDAAYMLQLEARSDVCMVD